MWEHLSASSRYGKLYVELAVILGRYMAKWSMDSWAINPTQHYLQAYIDMTEDIVKALRRDNATFNEARFRREIAEVSRNYAKNAHQPE